MKENTKNIIGKIENCTCLEDHYGRYLMQIKIKGRGERKYFYCAKEKSIESVQGGKVYYLSEEADKTVKDELVDYSVRIIGLEEWRAIKKYRKDKNLKICFVVCWNGEFEFEYCVRYRNRKGQEGSVYYKNSTLESMITKLYMISTVLDPKYEKTLLPALKSSTEKSIKKNPLYIAAKKDNDIYFINMLRKYYNLPEEKARKRFKERFRRRRLPWLSEDYDKYYIVSCKGMDTGLLRRSGYRILHRPYFAMFNSNHAAWQLNPCTKRGIDAAPDDQTPISFKEYLQLFEDEK